MFSKWLSEATPLRCDFEFGDFATACFRRRVKSLDDDGLRLLSDDGLSELALSLPPDLVFRFGDSRDDPGVAGLAAAVCLSRPAPDGRAFVDFVCLSEVT